MSAAEPRHLPPEDLADWYREAAEALEVGRHVSPDDDVAPVLDLTRELAITVARPAGPLSVFLLGLAVGGRVEGGDQVGPHLAELASRLRALAAERGEELMSEPTPHTEREL